MKLILENFRSFAGRHEIPIKPLTLLIGENSTGKTSVLAGLQMVSDDTNFPFNVDFNEAPYNLGTFANISHQAISSRDAGIDSFAFGFSSESDEFLNQTSSALASYIDDNGTPRVDNCALHAFDQHTARLTRNTSSGFYDLSIGTDDQKYSRDHLDEFFLRGMNWIQYLDKAIPNSILSTTSPKAPSKASASRFVDTLSYPFLHGLYVGEAVSIGPIRTKPQRTYDLSAPRPGAEGEEVPYVIDRMSYSDNDSSFELLRSTVSRFGTESQLFETLRSNRIGSNGGSRFELVANIDGVDRNIVDVGYGVGQVLPILVKSTVGEPRRLLIQQPEVHLHPKAQAALGSFFAELAGKHDRHFVIETHSDYMLDRIRIEVAKGTISADKVSFLYFERGENGTKWYDLGIDEVGNITTAPPSYRDFFFTEQEHLLERGS